MGPWTPLSQCGLHKTKKHPRGCVVPALDHSQNTGRSQERATQPGLKKADLLIKDFQLAGVRDRHHRRDLAPRIPWLMRQPSTQRGALTPRRQRCTGCHQASQRSRKSSKTTNTTTTSTVSSSFRQSRRPQGESAETFPSALHTLSSSSSGLLHTHVHRPPP